MFAINLANRALNIPIIGVLVALAVVGIPSPARATSSYPVQCDLYNSIEEGSGEAVGQVRGLENLAVPITIVLVVALLLVAFVPRLRRNLIEAVLWVATITLVGGIIVAAVNTFAPGTC